MILRPTKFQRHCSDRLPSQEKQCGAAEEVLALTVCTVWDPGKGPFLSPHVPTYKMGWYPAWSQSSHLAPPFWGFRNEQQASGAVVKEVFVLEPLALTLS